MTTLPARADGVPDASRATPQPPRSKTAFVYEWLKEEILSGSLTPGSRIRQQEVADALGVSFTPVREAIRQLQATGLITYESNRGSAVNVLAPSAVQELYRLRGAMEGLAARLAADSISQDQLAELESIQADMEAELKADADASSLQESSGRFHAIILEAGGPLIIRSKVEELRTNYPVPRSVSLWRARDHAERSIRAHGELLHALQAGDGVLAGTLMESHIVESADYRMPSKSGDWPTQ